MLFHTISKDYITAMKAKDKVRSGTLNFLRAQLKNLLIEKKAETLDDQDVISIIKKQVKQRQDSISQYDAGGRADLVEKEEAELKILKEYLPEELSQDQISIYVDEAIRELGASSMKEMGGVMKAVQSKTQGRADNKAVSDLVRQKLSQL